MQSVSPSAEKAAAPSGGLGLLGEKLQEAMSRKKK